MNKKIYPSFGQAILLILFLLVASLAGLPGYLPYLIWKNELTDNIAHISLYVAGFVLTIREALRCIKKSGDVFLISNLFKKKIDLKLAVLLIFLTLTVGVCIDYLSHLFNLMNFFKSEIDNRMKLPFISFVAIVILPAILEEILLRGIILERFSKRYSFRTSILLSALLFGIMHANPSQIFEGFIAGYFLGYVYLKTRNIKYCILIHFVNNGIFWLEYQLVNHFPNNSILNNLNSNVMAFFTALFLSIAGIFYLQKTIVKALV